MTLGNRPLNPAELVSPEFRLVLGHIHRVMASNHPVRDLQSFPGKSCTGKGVTMEGWKHWAYPFLLLGLESMGLLRVEPPGVFGLPEKRLFILGDGKGPLHGFLSFYGASVWAVDHEYFQIEGLTRQTDNLTRVVCPSDRGLPFGESTFDAGIVLGYEVTDPILKEVTHLIKPNGPLVFVLHGPWGWWSEPEYEALLSGQGLTSPGKTQDPCIESYEGYISAVEGAQLGSREVWFGLSTSKVTA